MLNHAVIEKDYNFINFLLIEGALKNNTYSKYNNILAISQWECYGMQQIVSHKKNIIINKYLVYNKLIKIYYKIYDLVLDNNTQEIQTMLPNLNNTDINLLLDTMNNSIIYIILTKEMLNLFLNNGLNLIKDINLSLLIFSNNKLFIEMIEYLLDLGCIFYNINDKIDIYNICIKSHTNKLLNYIEKETPMYKDLINIVINYIYE
jgi:hypothetical protein